MKLRSIQVRIVKRKVDRRLTEGAQDKDIRKYLDILHLEDKRQTK